jgi:flagellin
MSTSINTNISALAAQGSLRKTGLAQDTSMERLSTGIRINSAKDDAAGLAISTRMTANIRGISAAIRNANDGISLTQTAEGSLNAIQDNLQRIRELAVQSSNTGNNTSDRSALNAESVQLIAEIDRVASNSKFNGINLLDGTFQNQTLQVGSGNDSNDRILLSIGNAKASALGVNPGTSFLTTKSGTSVVNTSALAIGDLSINGYQVGASLNDGVSTATATGSGIAKANAINAISSQTGVTASVSATTTTGGAAAGTSTAATSANDILINGVDIGIIGIAATAPQQATQVAAAINAKSAQTGVTATFNTTDNKISLSAVDGRNIVVAQTAVGTTATGITAGTFTSTLTLTSNSSAGITVGGTSGGLAAVNITGGFTTAVAAAGVDLTTASSAQSALTTLDRAINTITDSRAAMGAYQNRLTASISNLETTSMNLQASRSRILDTDYAKETTNLAKSQIITQAATAMLAQANQSAQSVLALLK